MIDANMLSCGINSSKDRRGIFFITYNLVNELIKRKEIKLYFFINKYADDRLKNYIKKEWPQHDNVFFEYRPLIFFNLFKKYKNNRVISYILLKFLDYQKRKHSSYRNKFFSKYPCDVFFSTCNKIPGIFKDYSFKKFTIIYDFIPYVLKDVVSSELYVYFQNLVDSFNKDDYYFTISEYTKRDFFKYVPRVNPDHVFNSFVSCNDAFSPVEISDLIKEKYHIPLNKKYILSIFGIEKRKNLEMNIKAFISFVSRNHLTDIVYVACGFQGDYKLDFLENQDMSNIIFTGYVNDSDICSLYSGAEFFVYTSMYEGFGLPVLEAMKCGCPVIVSTSSSLPEVVGDAGIQVEWNSEEQHIKGYEKYYFDQDFRKESIRKGFIQSQKFSWKKTVDFMVEKIEENI